MQRVSVRGVIRVGQSILLMHRVKHGDEYWVVPGGGMEVGESYEETVVREIREEVGIEVRPVREIFRVEFGKEEYRENRGIVDTTTINRISLPGWSALDIFYLCEYASGEIGTGNGVEFADRAHPDNTYEIQEVTIDELEYIAIRPQEIRQHLLDLLRSETTESL